MRLNLGCGAFPTDGWTNVDMYVEGPGIIKGDFREMTWENVEEVMMSHVLEHLPWTQTREILERVRSWMLPNARLTVEVPDMVRIMADGTRGQFWQAYVYGSQSHPGEFHMAGFSAQSLYEVILAAGFQEVHVTVFGSEHPSRRGLPCLEAVARV